MPGTPGPGRKALAVVTAAAIFRKCFESCLTWSLGAICLLPMEVCHFVLYHSCIFAQIVGFFPSLFCNCLATPLSLEVINTRPCGGGWMPPVPMASGAGWFATKHRSCWRDGCDYCGSACPRSYVDFVSLIYRSVELAAQHQWNWAFQKFIPSSKSRLSCWHGAGLRKFFTYMEV